MIIIVQRHGEDALIGWLLLRPKETSAFDLNYISHENYDMLILLFSLQVYFTCGVSAFRLSLQYIFLENREI